MLQQSPVKHLLDKEMEEKEEAVLLLFDHVLLL